MQRSPSPPSRSICLDNPFGPMALTRSLREWADPEIVLIPGTYMVGPRSNESLTTHTMDASWLRFVPP